MYLIKQKGIKTNAMKLKANDVISLNKKWYVIREELELEDLLKLTGLRDGTKYTIEAVVSFGVVDSFLKVGRIISSRYIEEIDIETISVKKKVSIIETEKIEA
jgi:hypothetical protein